MSNVLIFLCIVGALTLLAGSIWFLDKAINFFTAAGLAIRRIEVMYNDIFTLTREIEELKPKKKVKNAQK